MLTKVPLFFLLVAQCAAYCIYNDLPEGAGKLKLYQQPLNTGSTYLSRFSHAGVKPGESACCSYTNKDCNKHGNPEEILEMTITRITSDDVELFPFMITFPAGGSIRISGNSNPKDDKTEVFNADGSRFEKAKVHVYAIVT